MVVIDPQIAAVRDNGTEQGVISAEIIGGKLIRLPFSPQNISEQTIGTGSASYQKGGIYYNLDGSQTGYSITVSSGTANAVALWLPFYGRTFGVRYRSSSSIINSFSVSVDGGDVVRVVDPETYLKKESQSSSQNHEMSVITHTDLSNSIHFAKIMVSGGYSVFLHGILVESGAYGNAPTPMCHGITNATGSVAVPLSSTSFSPYPASSGVPLSAISKVFYYNAGLSSATVTLSTQANDVFAVYGIASSSHISIDFPVPITSNSYKHLASASGVKAVAVGAVNI